MQDVTIRDALPDDITEILEVTERAWNAAYNDILSQATIDATITELHESDATRRLIDRDEGAYFVAEYHDELVGYISGGPSDEENVAILGALYVDPEYWKRDRDHITDGIRGVLSSARLRHCSVPSAV